MTREERTRRREEAIEISERGNAWPLIAMSEDWSEGWWLNDIGLGHIETHGPGAPNTCLMTLGAALSDDEIDAIADDEVIHVIR